MAFVEYVIGADPEANGVYACRVPKYGWDAPIAEDCFLLWLDNEWVYVGSNQRYRGVVLGWIGPLRRRLPNWQQPASS